MLRVECSNDRLGERVHSDGERFHTDLDSDGSEREVEIHDDVHGQVEQNRQPLKAPAKSGSSAGLYWNKGSRPQERKEAKKSAHISARSCVQQSTYAKHEQRDRERIGTKASREQVLRRTVRAYEGRGVVPHVQQRGRLAAQHCERKRTDNATTQHRSQALRGC
jgi:hypothetical protein